MIVCGIRHSLVITGYAEFTTPLPWLVGVFAILGCLYLFYSLPVRTQSYFLIWNAIGLLIYWVYGAPRAEAARARVAAR